MTPTMQNLFGHLDPTPAPKDRHSGPYASVALENHIDRLLDYAIPAGIVGDLRPGQRVRVPLGRNNKPAHGYVVSIHPTTTYPPNKVKQLFNIDDDRVLVDEKLMRLSRWMSRYYVAPLGTVLESVIPSAVKKKIGVGTLQMVRLIKPREELQAMLEKTRAPKRRALFARLLLVEPETPIELHRLANEAGTRPATVRKLAKAGLISITPEIDLPNWRREENQTLESGRGAEAEIALNEHQQKVFDDLKPRLTSGFSVNLLLGVTGSGKTEVYLHAIREILAVGRQAIVLVPEIALTPQTVRRFTARFKRVAILHSGLTPSERHRYWQQISTGHADIVVGARSATFAPLPNLGLIIVDEEHEASYKQDTAPRYQARDIAIKRGQIEGIPVLLGSATPSLETYHRVESRSTSPSPGTPGECRGEGLPHSRTSSPIPLPECQEREPTEKTDAVRPTYHLLHLPARVRGLSMPHVELVDMKMTGRFRKGVHLISERLEHLLRVTLEQNHQAILLLNRRGYSNFVYCPSCQNAVQCKYCDTTMTYHRSAGTHIHTAAIAPSTHAGTLQCHYCLAVSPLPETCPDCKKKLTLFGLGTQRVEEEIARKFPDLKFARVDSDTMRNSRDYEQLLSRFARGEIQVMLGTQMIAKGLDYPNVTLVGVISGDTALALPDFRAAERTFQLITQVAGRAGRGDAPGRVVLQTFLPDDPTIQAAIKQDYIGFARKELLSRREVGLPPFARMARIILRDQEPEKLHKHSEELAADLAAAVEAVNTLHPDAPVAMKGPMPCAISRIAGYHRYQIVLTCARSDRLQLL
jgi:primosomal protein N' (replication factor Y)